MEDTIAARLKHYIESLGITVSQFADACGIPRPSMSQLLTGRNKKVSNTLMEQIHAAYPELSIMWLMFGEGDINNSDHSADGQDNPSKEGINSVDTDNPSDNGKYLKENGLKNQINHPNTAENKTFAEDLRILDLQRQIAAMKKNPRKVTQITIYYEDSTFETFVPGHK